MSRRRTVLLALLGAIAVVSPARGDDRGKLLDGLLRRYEQYGFSGVVLVAAGGRVLLHEGYGPADRERGSRNTRETLFEIGSLTKTFTAAAILQLEFRGKLRTEDPIARHLGPFPEPKAAATIHHLATHTAGLLPEGYDLPYDDDRERFVRAMKDAPRESPPGEKYRYTNAGYSLLAAIVERVSGVPFEVYVRDQLFAPAGLKSARFRNDAASRLSRLARGYLGSPAEVKLGPPPPYPWGTRGAGGIVSTVGDLHRWYLALQAGRVLPPPARQKVFHPWPQEGYGWHVGKDDEGRQRIDKGGGMPNYAAHLLHYPDRGIFVAWASNNLSQRWRRTLNRSLTAVAFGEAPLLPPAVRKIDPDTLAKYAGRYETKEGKVVEIRAGARHLYATPNDLGVPEEVFFFSDAPDQFTGVQTTQASLASLRFTRPDRRTPGTVTATWKGGGVIAERVR